MLLLLRMLLLQHPLLLKIMCLRILLRLKMHHLLLWYAHTCKLRISHILTGMWLHHVYHALLLLVLLHLMLQHLPLPLLKYMLLMRWHLGKCHLSILLLLEHGSRLARSEVCHRMRILHRSTGLGCNWSLRHSCDHWTLCHLWTGYTWMHTLHHRRVGSSHMSCSWVHTCHWVAVGKAWVSAGSHTGGKRWSHHLIGAI